MFDRKIIKGYQLGSWACVFQRLYPFSQKKKKDPTADKTRLHI